MSRKFFNKRKRRKPEVRNTKQGRLYSSIGLMAVAMPLLTNIAGAQPALVDSNLAVRTTVTGLAQPTTMSFLNSNELFVLEKGSGKVQHVVNGDSKHRHRPRGE